MSIEEPEASGEELRSPNEELKRVKHQLRTRIVDLETRTDDLTNLLNSTDIAILLLGRELCIRRLTPPTAAAIHLR